MTLRERITRMFGAWSRVPDYLRKAVGMREAAAARREREAREAREREEAERARIKALRRPPRNVRLDGRVITWEEPETAGELPPAGYWVSECYKGEWTKHGDYVLPNARAAVLFGDGPRFGRDLVSPDGARRALQRQRGPGSRKIRSRNPG